RALRAVASGLIDEEEETTGIVDEEATEEIGKSYDREWTLEEILEFQEKADISQVPRLKSLKVQISDDRTRRSQFMKSEEDIVDYLREVAENAIRTATSLIKRDIRPEEKHSEWVNKLENAEFAITSSIRTGIGL